ncbi:MAG: aldose 1-epimerase family protein [Pirellulales bacterium]|nr:aldose 1-epimerase family protein [Pirellulales bacterium]
MNIVYPRAAGVLLFLMTVSGVSAIEPVSKTLISVEQNIRESNWECKGETHEGAEFSIIKSTLHGGKQEGVDIVTIDNGRLKMIVVPTRGMSILGVSMGPLRLGWDSPVREVVHPSLINLQDREGLGWLDGFNEWLVRCGLEFAGHPGIDTFRDNTGAISEQRLTLHGKIGNIPASEVTVSVEPGPPHILRLRGRVDEISFYGAALELQTEVSTTVGSHEFEIRDMVTNRGAESQEFEIIYHANFGPPLLESGASLVVPIRKVQPMNAVAAKSLQGFQQISGPVAGKKEEVFLIEPLSDSQGDTLVLLQNANRRLGCSVTYSLEQMPFLTIWKNTALPRSGYVMGIEPGTNYPFNRSVERKAGRLKKLSAGESAEFRLAYTLHSDEASVREAAERIAFLQEDFEPQVLPEPPGEGN